MTRMVRIDDFPHGDLALFNSGHMMDYQERVEMGLRVFEEYKVHYILGVSPGLLQIGDLDFLEKLVRHGKVVLHGYDHGWSRDWSRITESWAGGGEFEGQTIEAIRTRYNAAHGILRNLSCYDPTHYIPPFNAYNQNFLDVMQHTEVKYIHGCDKERYSYNLDILDHHGRIPLTSQYHKTYDFASEVIHNLDNLSQITLHWIYDSQRPSYEEDYRALAKALTE